jgi:DNA-directed RNA polymerase III subunit RPC1
LNPLAIYSLFERISNVDCEILGFKPEFVRPEDLILTRILVPPACIRPSVQMDGAQGTNEDDITIQLAEIVRYNSLIKSNMERGATIQAIMELWNELQIHCALMINSELPGISLSSSVI